MTITDTYTEELAIDLTGSALMPARKGMDVQRIDGEDGSLLVEFSATSSGCLFELVGKNGRLSVDVDADRLLGRIDLNGETRSLDAEDALGMADGTIHSVGLTADETGTHLFADGYETFSATLRAWCQDLRATSRASSTYSDSGCGTQPCPCKLWRPRRRRQHRSSSSLVLSCRPATHAVPENSLMAHSEQGPAFVAKPRVEPSSQPKGAPVNCPSRSSTATCSCTWKWTMNPSPTCALQASGTTETGMTW